jgi:hypothetical protein
MSVINGILAHIADEFHQKLYQNVKAAEPFLSAFNNFIIYYDIVQKLCTSKKLQILLPTVIQVMLSLAT